MADNQYVNRVKFGDQVVMDISDTTASASDVLSGKKLYTSSGAPATGTLVPGTITEVQANGTSVATSGIANIPAASTSEYGVTKLNDTTSSTSTSEAATAAVVKRLNDNISNKLNTELSFTASSISDFLSQILDYAVSLGNAGNRIVGMTWQYHYFCNVTICSQSATRHVAIVVPQPSNSYDIYIAEYSNGTKAYKQIAMTWLS